MNNIYTNQTLQALLREKEVIHAEFKQVGFASERAEVLRQRRSELEKALAAYQVPKYSTEVRILSGLAILSGLSGFYDSMDQRRFGDIGLHGGLVLGLLGSYGLFAKKIDPRYLA